MIEEFRGPRRKRETIVALRRVFVDPIRGTRARVRGPRAHHLHRVVRLRVGELVEISDHERLFLAAVSRSTGEEVEFEIRESLAQPASAPTIVLMIAVIKFARLEWAIEKATELGVSSIIPVVAARCEARLIQAAGKRHERWQRIAEEAAQQSRRLAPPSIEPPMPLIEALPKHDAQLPIILDTDCPPLKKVAAGFRRKAKRPQVNSAVLLVGPEGGWTDAEREAAHRAGYQPASLGGLILRSETAAVTALGVLAHLLGA